MKYFFITFLISSFVIFYVWQNIEVMKIKMTYNRLLVKEDKLKDERNKLLYKLERNRNFKNVQKIAETSGYKKIEPDDVFFVTEKIKAQKGGKKSK